MEKSHSISPFFPPREAKNMLFEKPSDTGLEWEREEAKKSGTYMEGTLKNSQSVFGDSSSQGILGSENHRHLSHK